ncbi:hypothetical protein [Embleya sp. NPDC005971]|uniref:hypothetical protein n=1 Tax=unclassified Embleya TaxID=2699296 RepID=UPI0033C519F8
MLALGGAATTAQAAAPAPVSKVSAGKTNVELKAGWHFYRAYWTKAACLVEGDALGGVTKCQYQRGNDGKMKWFLYRWY